MNIEIKVVSSKVRLIIVFAALVMGSSSINAATVAYWRFETGPANTDVPHPGAAGVFNAIIPDDSGNGNSLSVWAQGGGSGYAYRADVPDSRVPQFNAANKFSVKNTGSYPALFTSAAGSSPTGINAQTITPAQFTIEVSYKPEISGTYRTIVCRDARNVATANPDLAALYLQIRPDDSMCITFTDVSGYVQTANTPPGWAYGFNYGSNPEGVGAPWYHLVAVSDGSTLKLYVNNLLIASTDMTLSGSPNRALAKGTTSGTDWNAGAWAVGRGLYAGGHTDRAFGLIDEVRISNSALAPGEFLFAPKPLMKNLKITGGNLMFDVIGGQPGITCQVLRSLNLATPLSQWAPIASRTFDTNGNCSYSTAINASTPQYYFMLKATIQTTPPVGALTYSLAGGSETWPADVRARIIYAMDGAVAEYNRYGTFNGHITANYNPGVPTAQASFGGWIDFGPNASYQQFRTALHETGHTLGMGTTWQWRANMSVATGTGTWIGANGVAQIHVFDGGGGVITSDGTHFWPYGLNYDNEGSTENFRRHVLMMSAFRKDMGLQ